MAQARQTTSARAKVDILVLLKRGYLKTYKINTRLVCTYFNAFFNAKQGHRNHLYLAQGRQATSAKADISIYFFMVDAL